MPAEPNSYKEMIKHPHAAGFKGALNTELEALIEKGTWQEVPLEHAHNNGKAPIPTRWVLKYKFDDRGYLLKYMARLCVRGDLQKTSTDTYAATLAARTLRALLAIKTAHEWHQTLAHASPEVIKHLEASAEGVKILDDAKAPKTTRLSATVDFGELFT